MLMSQGLYSVEMHNVSGLQKTLYKATQPGPWQPDLAARP